MSYCQEFNCQHEKNGICSYSEEVCVKEHCITFYAKCDACNCGKECLFKEEYLKSRKNYISIMNYRNKNKQKKNLERVYAVRKGRVPGIYKTWLECFAQIDGYAGAEYQQFVKPEEASAYMTQKEQRKNITAYAYVDGSYNKYTKTYGYGGIINDGTKEHEIMGSGANPEMASMRNVAGEIEGAMAAIRYAEQNGIQELTIYYDYIGIENWPTGKWNANQKGTQLYRDYVRNAKIKIYFKKVKGHSGVRGNEKADMLAKMAVGVV